MRPDRGDHFLIATEAETASGAMEIPLDGVDAFAIWEHGVHGFGPEQIAELHCLLLETEIDYKILDQYTIVFTHDEMHGPWLIKVPSQMTEMLASLDDLQVAVLCGKWLSISNGFRYREAPLPWVQLLAEKLVLLAKLAMQEGKNLYWEPPSC